LSITLNELRKLVKETLQESNLLTERSAYDRVVKALKGERNNINSVGIMTAQNPDGQKQSEEFNQKQNEKLIAFLRYMNLGHYRIGGKFAGAEEESFAINNVTKETMIKLGKHFGQESIIWGERIGPDEFLFHYIDSASGESPTEPVSMVLTHPDPAVISRKDMYSTVGKGKKTKKFVIPFFEDGYAHRNFKQKDGKKHTIQ